MFEQIVSIGQLLLTGLSCLPSTNRRRGLGKSLSTLYRDLFTILKNGDTILRLFRQHNNGKDINIDTLKALLEEQHYLISRIIATLRTKAISTIIAIRAPEITPLQILLFEKGSRVKFYLNKFTEAEARRADSADYRCHRWIHTNTRIELPDNKAIDHSRKQLRQIKFVVENLRKFITENFEVDDII